MTASVRVEGVSKVYRLYSSPWQRIVELVTRRRRHRPFYALRGVGFELQAGERLGVIGENGAGKSTLLKLLAGVASPSSGEVRVEGRVASILELGSGFHPELTGRQNIALNAAMMGLDSAQLAACLDGIVGFSELGEFIDRPVKSYSTGMAMRLAFAIATQVDPDILIIDEALSVGDGYFQKKCMDRLLELADDRRILLFCSHALYYVDAFCTRALWLKEGEVARLGPVIQVVRAYEEYLLARQAEAAPEVEAKGAVDAGPARLLEVRQHGGGERRPEPGEWSVEVSWESSDPELPFHLGVGVDRSDGVQLCSFATHQDRLPPFCGAHRYAARLRVPRLPVVKGDYHLYVFLMDGNGMHVYDRAILTDALSVGGDSYRLGMIAVDHEWTRLAAPEERASALLSGADGAAS